ncbi:hypothetical protein CYJ73_04270 [Gordonia terrae]|uniref:Uncharacterized protein n=1 Tax=Gordonia terrae TaxID=2055 RepID=A0A2I1RCS8_9ACTN|nr:hypothetical protein [Gordonia terrae]PKZ66947.1 hypothetical protein CYJ73_04270 [Gordonia terrae]
MNSTVVNTVMILAEEPQGPEFGKASPLGLLVILLLLVGTAFLIWSMSRQLKKLPASFDTEHPEPDQAFDEGTDSPGPAESGTATPDAPGSPDATTAAGTTDDRRPADT